MIRNNKPPLQIFWYNRISTVTFKSSGQSKRVLCWGSETFRGSKHRIGQVNTVVNIQVSGPGLEQLPPSFGLGLLGVQSRGADELADEVQAMDVSPVSKDELTSNLPDNELQKSSTSNACALEDLLDITSQVSCPALSAGEPLGDCNKNLIEDFYPSAEAQLIQSFISSPDERNLQ
ncbi:hypothetical protein Z043_110362 [Scleropages formosus]|uniref:Uncharacterized protein n=1 Tax=Scleropages formosus TaxID=113540 RepID=A0A0N8K003_SCLFO|nr:hypothetical protein Z043_110362 [Scleropages formosus]